MHEYYSLDLSHKTKSDKYTKMKRCKYISEVCCYGYKKGTDGLLAIDGEAAVAVHPIFTLESETKNAQEFVKALYADKISTPGEYGTQRERVSMTSQGAVVSGRRSSVLRILTDVLSRKEEKNFLDLFIRNGNNVMVDLYRAFVDFYKHIRIPNHITITSDFA